MKNQFFKQWFSSFSSFFNPLEFPYQLMIGIPIDIEIYIYSSTHIPIFDPHGSPARSPRGFQGYLAPFDSVTEQLRAKMEVAAEPKEEVEEEDAVWNG